MFIKETDSRVLSSFFPEGKEITLKRIMERSGLSYEPVYRTVKDLVEKKIILSKKFGKTLVYSLNLQNIYSEIGFDYYMSQKEVEFMKRHRIIYNAIKKIKDSPPIWMVVLFGSYSKGTESKKSDVDIICISDKKNETEHFVKSLKYETNLDFTPVVLPLYEFPNIKRDNPVLWNDLKEHGLVFKGVDSFYFWMYKDDK